MSFYKKQRKTMKIHAFLQALQNGTSPAKKGNTSNKYSLNLAKKGNTSNKYSSNADKKDTK